LIFAGRIAAKKLNKNYEAVLREPKEILEEMKKSVLKKAFAGEL